MTVAAMTLVERLDNPQWRHEPGDTPQLDVDRTLADMASAAEEIRAMRLAIDRYLAGDYGCNGGAEALFEAWRCPIP